MPSLPPPPVSGWGASFCFRVALGLAPFCMHSPFECPRSLRHQCLVEGPASALERRWALPLSVRILPLNALAPSATSSSGPLVAGLPPCPASLHCQPPLPVPDGIACSLWLSPFWLQRASFTNGHSRCWAWGVNGQFICFREAVLSGFLGRRGSTCRTCPLFFLKPAFRFLKLQLKPGCPFSWGALALSSRTKPGIGRMATSGCAVSPVRSDLSLEAVCGFAQ